MCCRSQARSRFLSYGRVLAASDIKRHQCVIASSKEKAAEFIRQTSWKADRAPSARVERHCARPSCGEAFMAKPSEIARGAGRYCSALCRDLARRNTPEGEARRISEQGPSPCEGTPSRPVPSKPRPAPSIVLVCATCGAPFRVHPHRALPGRQAKFCSKPCANVCPKRRPNPKRGSRRESQFGGLHCETCGHPVTGQRQEQSSSTGVKRWCSIECTAAYFQGNQQPLAQRATVDVARRGLG